MKDDNWYPVVFVCDEGKRICMLMEPKSRVRLKGELKDVAVAKGGVSSEVVYAGPQGDYIGLDQVNLKLPRSLADR